MKIFHGPIEIAGQMGILCGELKRRGHIAVGYNHYHTYLGYKDHLINITRNELENLSKHIINFFDVFHYHYSESIISEFVDISKIHALGKKVIMHHWGNDVRFHEQAKKVNPFVNTEDSPSNEIIHQRLKKISHYIKEAIVQDYEVYSYVEPYYDKVHIVPIAINLSKIPVSIPSKTKQRPLIIHAPTNPTFKGTFFIEEAINQLKLIYDFEYRRLEKMNHDEALKVFQKADIIVDQILCGSYGLLSVEAMAMGKPVVTYIREDLISRFHPSLPIVNANPETIYHKVEMLLQNPQLRHELGKKGRCYVEKVHSVDLVVDQLFDIYKS